MVIGSILTNPNYSYQTCCQILPLYRRNSTLSQVGLSSQADKVLRTKDEISMVIGSIPPNPYYSYQTCLKGLHLNYLIGYVVPLNM